MSASSEGKKDRFRYITKFDTLYLLKFISLGNWGTIFIGVLLAICTGAGLPHLVCVVGWILNIYIYVPPESAEFRTRITSLLIYFCTLAVMLSMVAFFQFMCFKFAALKIGRRIRHSYFRHALHQGPEFFANEQVFEVNKFVEADIVQLVAFISDSLPNIAMAISQLAVAMVISYTLVWRLALVVSGLGLLTFFIVLIFSKLVSLETEREKRLALQTKDALGSRVEFQNLMKRHVWMGVRKGFFNGILTGWVQFGLYLGMGTGAIYGNWLMDRDMMKFPSYIFVVACTIVPAAVRIAGLPAQLAGWVALGKVGKALRLAKAEVNGKGEFDKKMLEKRKQFLVSYIRTEVGTLPEKLHHHKSPAFRNLKRSVFSHWFLWALALPLCGMTGVSAAALTKMNGNMFDFYNKVDNHTYFYLGIGAAWRYLVVGVSVFIAAIASGTLIGYISESGARKLRMVLFECGQNGFLEHDLLNVLIARYAVAAKGAFDNRLAVFLIGILSIVCAILSNVHKSLVFSFLTTVAFSMQTVAQFFMFRFADMHTRHANKAAIKRGLKVLELVENYAETEIDDNLHEISRQHNHFLSFRLHKQTSVIIAQALKFTFTIGVPQVTQSFSYSIGSYMIADKLLQPISVYKIIQTIYTSVGVVSALAQFPYDVHLARLAAQRIDDNIELNSVQVDGASRRSSTSSTDSSDD